MIKYNEFGEVISVNGITTGQHLGTPMQDAIAEKPEDNEAYGTIKTIEVTESCKSVVEDVQPENISYNDLSDKPFYEETITVTDTLTWDGNTDGLICADDTFYKVSDIVLTASDVSNGVSLVNSVNDIDSTIDLPAEVVQNAFSDLDGFAIIADFVVVVPYDGWDKLDFAFPKAGIYFLNYGGTTRVKSFTVNGYKGFKTEKTVVHPINKKYLPESLQFGLENYVVADVTFTGNEENNRIDVPSLDIEKWKTYTFEVNGSSFEEVVCTEEYGSGHAIINFIGEDHGVDFNIQANAASPPFILCSEPAHVVIKGVKTIAINQEYLPKMDYIPELDSAPTAIDFNRLLSYLREAGYMKYRI